MDQVGSHRAGLPDRRYEARFSGEPARGFPGWMHPVARIRKSRALTAHLIHAKTEQVLHLLLESGSRIRGLHPFYRY